MKLIVGLGNVGQAYVQTRHNVGFMVVQRLAEHHRVPLRQRLARGRRLVACYGDWACGADVVRLLLPQTMMNRSGEALASLAKWNVASRDVLMVLDDVNLPLGQLRVRASGGAGGHHGLVSCLEAMQTQAVPRLRVGVQHDLLPEDLTEFVLSPFNREEEAIMRRSLNRAVEVCEVWAQDGLKGAMDQMSRDHQ